MTELGKAMVDVRAQVLVVRGLARQMKCAQAESEKNYFDRKLKQQTKLLIDMEAKARSLMNDLKPEMYAFCVMYYINGMSLAVTAESLDRSVRQCARYKKRIENE